MKQIMCLAILALLPLQNSFAKGNPILCNKCIKESERCLTKVIVDETESDRVPASEVERFCDRKLSSCGKKYKCEPYQLEALDMSYKKDLDMVTKIKNK